MLRIILTVKFLLYAAVKADSLPNNTSIGNIKFNRTISKGCLDVFGKSVASGDTYVPGPDYCSVCQCENGSDRFCKAVLCQPRQDCSSFRTGETCCDFICLDDVLNPNYDRPIGGYQPIPESGLGVRLAAAILTALCAFVLLLFLVHRLRQRRITAQQYVNAQDACCHAQAYWHNSDQAQLFLQGAAPFPPWKPPSYSMEAPPPYTEADAQRAEMCIASSSSSNNEGGSTTVGLVTNPMDHQGVFNSHIPGHSRAGSMNDATIHQTNNNDEEDVVSFGGHQRSSSFIPANLGPLAVQLLPTDTQSNSNLREQIQRQRQNLTHSNNSCTLPRTFPNLRRTDNTLMNSTSRRDPGYEEMQHSSQPNIREADNEDLDGLVREDGGALPNEVERSGEETGEMDEEEGTQVSHVRQSVLRFEAAAAAAADPSHDSPKH